jgi:two-component sensor histidine kinase
LNEIRDNRFDDEFTVLMDLVSHDILNINQAVLSAIELMTESSRVDERTKGHARKLESQIRICTQIFESIRMLCLAKKTDKVLSEQVDLNEMVAKAISNVSRMFPDKKVSVELERSAERAVVTGGMIVHETLVNALMGIFQLDGAEHATILAEVAKGECKDGTAWTVRLIDDNVAVPTLLEVENLSGISTNSRTKTVKIAGLALARAMAERLNGALVASAAGEGSEFRIKFIGAE